jgi:hypothetical protein
MYPACAKLQKAPSDYRTAVQELLEYRGKETKAELAMSEALEDGDASTRA